MIRQLILISLVISVLKADTYFKSVAGTVPAGNFTYYSLITKGAIQIILKTKKGDADLYISQVSVTPTFDVEGYCLHSATCGVDVIDIPSSFARPVGIGVYGHPSHEESDYILELKIKGEADDVFTDNVFPNAKRSPEVDDREYEEDDEAAERPFILTFILAFIDIFLEVILL